MPNDFRQTNTVIKVYAQDPECEGRLNFHGSLRKSTHRPRCINPHKVMSLQQTNSFLSPSWLVGSAQFNFPKEEEKILEFWREIDAVSLYERFGQRNGSFLLRRNNPISKAYSSCVNTFLYVTLLCSSSAPRNLTRTRSLLPSLTDLHSPPVFPITDICLPVPSR